MQNKRLAVIGVGAMGQALVKGVIGAGLMSAADIVAYDADADKLQTVAQQIGFRAAASNLEAAGSAEIILLAVKPQQIPEAVRQIAPACGPSTLVISIAAGVTLATLETGLPAGTPAIRVMPNTPCLVGAAASAVSLGRSAEAVHRDRALAIFGSVGRAVVLAESLLDAVTGLSGSGPAYGYICIEALSDGGVAAGLPRDIALVLAAQTLLGAAKMVLETGRHPGELKDMVTSPGGTTAAALRVLEAKGLRSALAEAVVKAAERSAELGRKAQG